MGCELCNGTGFVLKKQGIYEIAHPCICREKMITEIRLKASGISEAFQQKTLDGFNDRGIQTLAEAKQKAMRYIENYKVNENTTHNSIMFLGNPGSGKTHLSLAIANTLLNDQQVSCLYMPFREIMTELKHLNRSEDKTKYEELMFKLRTARLLIIDDLFKGGATEADINYMFQIINQRYLNNLPFIASSEKTPTELLGIDEAVASRMLEQAKGSIINFKGKELNYRLFGET